MDAAEAGFENEGVEMAVNVHVAEASVGAEAAFISGKVDFAEAGTNARLGLQRVGDEIAEAG